MNFLTDEGLATLRGGYLLEGESPVDMYRRVAAAAASYQKDSTYWEDRFFDAMSKNWLCPATPVLSNLGTTRGLPISCDAVHVGDSVGSIFQKNHELAMLSKNGAGVAVYLGDIRGRGAAIKGNGTSEGIVPWAKVYDTTTLAISQGMTRRAAGALYLPVEHPDIEEFLNIRRPVGDMNRRCLNVNHAVTIGDAWMMAMLAGDVKKRALWIEILKARFETGEPYLFFTDAVERGRPECYKYHGLQVVTSNICTEVVEYTDPNHTFVCCLSSLNLEKWDEWCNTDLVEVSIRFLDSVMSEYIDRTEGMEGLECARRSAIKGRDLGLGVLGWHTLLQKKRIPFDSYDAMQLNGEVFRHIRSRAEAATAALGAEFEEPEWCSGFGRRNAHLLAIAPTVSNSAIAGGHSAGIEPMAANIFSVKSAKGTFIRKNHQLETLLENRGKNTASTWRSINEMSGAVQHLDFLTDLEREVFKTAREINQYAIVKQAGQRQRWIDQSQSVNLFFAANSDPKYIHDVHVEAWKQGMKTLYYLRTEGVIRGDLASRRKDECIACDG